MQQIYKSAEEFSTLASLRRPFIAHLLFLLFPFPASLHKNWMM